MAFGLLCEGGVVEHRRGMIFDGGGARGVFSYGRRVETGENSDMETRFLLDIPLAVC